VTIFKQLARLRNLDKRKYTARQLSPTTTSNARMTVLYLLKPVISHAFIKFLTRKGPLARPNQSCNHLLRTHPRRRGPAAIIERGVESHSSSPMVVPQVGLCQRTRMCSATLFDVMVSTNQHSANTSGRACPEALPKAPANAFLVQNSLPGRAYREIP